VTDDTALLEAPLPARRRTKRIGHGGAALAAVTIAALGFLGGVQVQKAQEAGTSGYAGGFPGRAPAGGQAPGGQAQDGATTGEVSSVDGSTFYVEDASGNTVRVRAGSKAEVSRTAVAGAEDIHPGDTVVVQGRTADSGTVVASSVVATAADAGG
jgi:hypothetical protein